MYIPAESVRSILDPGTAVALGQSAGRDPAVVGVPEPHLERYRPHEHVVLDSDGSHRTSLQDGPEAGRGLGSVRVYDGAQERVVELDEATGVEILTAAVGFDAETE